MATTSAPDPVGYHEHKADYLTRLKDIEEQVRGLSSMLEEDRYCIDVLTQVAAITRALHEVASGLLDDHARNCLVNAIHGEPGVAEAKLDELTRAVRRMTRV